MEAMNVVLAMDLARGSGVATHFLIGVADRATRNWLVSRSVMAASFVAQRIRAGARFEACCIGKRGPDLVLQSLGDGSEAVVMARRAGGGFTLKDMPPCGDSAGSGPFRGGKPV
ncbi:hypothetical protein LC605_23050 [Nostoc sp. CHAB 5836]|nr:hypothetical protein [Nostoc sp. CHAB 5836]